MRISDWSSDVCSSDLLDIVIALCALPIVAVIAVTIAVLNPFFNPGRLLYRQERIGMYGKPFIALKFRSMTEVHSIDRGHYDGIESDRLTRHGRLLLWQREVGLSHLWNILKIGRETCGARGLQIVEI